MSDGTLTLPFTEARNRLTDLIEKVNQYFSHFVITCRGEPKAVLMSKEEYDSLMETLEITSDRELMMALRQGEKDFKSGKTIAWENLRDQLHL